MMKKDKDNTPNASTGGKKNPVAQSTIDCNIQITQFRHTMIQSESVLYATKGWNRNQRVVSAR